MEADIKIKTELSSVYHRHQQKNAGFTLIELMIALALGLIIVAAGLAVFLSSSRSLGLQSSMGELQQNANFGLSLVTHDLRHTNLNTLSSQRVNNITIGSGLIFKKENLPTALQNFSNLETEYATLENKSLDNTSGNSDQLTMQYVPASSTVTDCEGNDIEDASSKNIIQRYYVAETPQQLDGEPKSYSLYCDAGYYEASDNTIIGLGENAQQIMQRVDAFKIRLGIRNPAGNLRYMTVNEYITEMDKILGEGECETDKYAKNCTSTYLNVVSIDVGILSRSTGSIGADANLNTKKTFEVAGSSVTLAGDEALNKKYLRQAVNQVVAIRNTLGAS